MNFERHDAGELSQERLAEIRERHEKFPTIHATNCLASEDRGDLLSYVNAQAAQIEAHQELFVSTSQAWSRDHDAQEAERDRLVSELAECRKELDRALAGEEAASFLGPVNEAEVGRLARELSVLQRERDALRDALRDVLARVVSGLDRPADGGKAPARAALGEGEPEAAGEPVTDGLRAHGIDTDEMDPALLSALNSVVPAPDAEEV